LDAILIEEALCDIGSKSGPHPMVSIEVQPGLYVGEDDMIRYEDRDARA